ncbi:MAG TPA: ADOP family duplicated permease [Candidatus Acidoferrum sp.]|nr:ADOP family duplicated permease [Candidatus Acidoferrum sp.]
MRERNQADKGVLRMTEAIFSILRNLRITARSLAREKGLTLAVVVTLALGIGANAVMFSLVRGVLLRPLVNRDEDHLIYIRQSAPGINDPNVTFSIPEIQDITSRVKTLSSFGDFSTIGFTMIGLGQPQSVNAGVVDGSYFQVMGLRPVLGRLLGPHDDGPNAAGAVVLTYRFWSTDLRSDPHVIGKSIRLDSYFDSRRATVVGVLEPCVPYPADTEIIGNIVTSSHHLSATMNTSRIHRMTELFGRLAPGATLEQARAELRTVYGAMKAQHPDAYSAKGDFQISAVRLRDELTSGARTILLVLMAMSILIFVIACSNVANLILARSLRRQSELGIRSALGATSGNLRRTLLIESLVLCVTGAALGLLIASPMVAVLGKYMSRYSVRALDIHVDASMLWVGAGLAVLAAALLAFVPRLPSAGGAQAFGLTTSSTRVTGAANRKLRIFAVVQIAASFVLVAAAGAAVKTLLSLQAARPDFDTQNVLAVNLPVLRLGRTPAQNVQFYKEAADQIRALPGVENVAIGTTVPWRDSDFAFAFQLSPDGRVPAQNDEQPRAYARIISPAFFATLGLPISEGRDFNDGDRAGSEPVAIVSESLAHRFFPNTDALNHHLTWTDPILKVVPVIQNYTFRIVGIVPDVDDMNIVPRPTMTVYRPSDQEALMAGGRMFVHSRSNPYTLVAPITSIMRKMSPDQPVEKAATLQDVRANVLSPDRLNAIVFGAFAGVALLIAVVGVAGVLAFSVSGRTREFGIRLALGSQPHQLLTRVIAEGAAIAIAGLVVGLAAGYGLAQLAGALIVGIKSPGMLTVASAGVVLLIAAIVAAAVPAMRAARVDVIEALRAE